MSLQPDRGRMSQLVAAEMRYFGSPFALSMVVGSTTLVSLVAVLFSVFYYIGQPHSETNYFYLVLSSVCLGLFFVLYFIYKIFTRIRGQQYNTVMLFSALCNAICAVTGFIFVRTTILWQLPDMARGAYDQFIRSVLSWSFLFPLILVVIYFALLFLFTDRPLPYIGWVYRVYIIAPVSILLLIGACSRLCSKDALPRVTTIITIVYLSLTIGLVLHFLFKMILNRRLVATPGQYETFIKAKHSVPKPGEIKVTAADLAAARHAVKAGKKPPVLEPAPEAPAALAVIVESAQMEVETTVIETPAVAEIPSLAGAEQEEPAAAVVETPDTTATEAAPEQAPVPAKPHIYKPDTAKPAASTGDKVAAFWQLVKDKATAAFNSISTDRNADAATTAERAVPQAADTQQQPAAPRGIEQVGEFLSSISQPDETAADAVAQSGAEPAAVVESAPETSLVEPAVVAGGETADATPAQDEKGVPWFERLKLRLTQFIDDLKMPSEAEYNTAPSDADMATAPDTPIEVVEIGPAARTEETAESVADSGMSETAEIAQQPAVPDADTVEDTTVEERVEDTEDGATQDDVAAEDAAQDDAETTGEAEQPDVAAVASDIADTGVIETADAAPEIAEDHAAPDIAAAAIAAAEAAAPRKRIYEAPGKQDRKAQPAPAAKSAAEKPARKPLYAYNLDEGYVMDIKPASARDVTALLARIHPPKPVAPLEVAPELQGEYQAAAEAAWTSVPSDLPTFASPNRKSKRQVYKAPQRELEVGEVIGTGITETPADETKPAPNLSDRIGKLFPPRQKADEVQPAGQPETDTTAIKDIETTVTDLIGQALPDESTAKNQTLAAFWGGLAARGESAAHSIRTWSASAITQIRTLGESARAALEKAKSAAPDTAGPADSSLTAADEQPDTAEQVAIATPEASEAVQIVPAQEMAAETPETGDDTPVDEAQELANDQAAVDKDQDRIGGDSADSADEANTSSEQDTPDSESEQDTAQADEDAGMSVEDISVDAGAEPEAPQQTEPSPDHPPVNDEPDIVEALEEPETTPAQMSGRPETDDELEEVLDDVVLAPEAEDAESAPDAEPAASVLIDSADEDDDPPVVQAMSSSVSSWSPPRGKAAETAGAGTENAAQAETPGISVVQVERVRVPRETRQSAEDTGRTVVRPRRRRKDR